MKKLRSRSEKMIFSEIMYKIQKDTMNIQENNINYIGKVADGCQDREAIARESVAGEKFPWQKKYNENLDYVVDEKFERAKNFDLPWKKVVAARRFWEDEWLEDRNQDFWREKEEKEDSEFHELLEKRKREKGQKKYIITFTVDPKNEKMKNLKDHMENQVSKVARSKSFDVKHVDWNMELTKKGVPHIHMYMECEKYVRKQAVLKLYKLGWVDIQKALHPQAALNYCLKEVENDDILII